jgi:hypothetical protein
MNKPLDRDYFKYKDNPRKRKIRLMDCCGVDEDDKGLNVNNEEDWKLIENHIQDVLQQDSSTETITPISCKVCGRFLRYQSTLNYKAWGKEYGKTN